MHLSVINIIIINSKIIPGCLDKILALLHRVYEGRIGKMHTNKHLKQNISQGKERERA